VQKAVLRLRSLFESNQGDEDVRQLLGGDEDLSTSLVSAPDMPQTEWWSHRVYRRVG
jgi:hypothetical protein